MKRSASTMARILLLVWAAVVVAAVVAPSAEAQGPGRLNGPPPGSSSNSTADNSTVTSNETSTNSTQPPANSTAPPANSTTSQPSNTTAPPSNSSNESTNEPPQEAPPQPSDPRISELGSTGMMTSGDLIVDMCIKSYRSFNREATCTFASGQRMYDRFWFVIHANKPFTYTIKQDGQVVVDAQPGTFRAEWNSSTTKQNINFRVIVKEVGGSDEVEYVFENMRVRTGGSEEDDEEGEGGPADEELVPKSLLNVMVTKSVVGACIAFLLGMPLAYAIHEEKDARMAAVQVL